MRITLIIPALILLLCQAVPAHAAQQQWPPDARDVAYAIACKATGQPGLANIAFAPGSQSGIEGAANGFYSAFQTGKIILVGYTNHGTGNAYDADLTGVINLGDGNNRMVALQFAAQYTVSGQNIRINRCTAVTASPQTAQVEVYLVPMETFATVPYEVFTDWHALHKLAVQNAYAPPLEGAAMDSYMVMTFLRNRLPLNAKFEAIVTDRKTGRQTKDNAAKDQERYMNFQGWRVHMFGAKFSPTSFRDRFYINYYYTPGNGVPGAERKRVQIARWDSKPEDNGQPRPSQPMVVEEAPRAAPAPQPAPARPGAQAIPSAQPAPQAIPGAQTIPSAQPPRQAIPEAQPAPQAIPGAQPVPQAAPAPATASAPGPGPLERGMSFLNPVFPDDVELIQKRLRELGVYKGPIDRKFGPMTKRALDHYAVGQGYPKGQWSLGLQKVLFKGTGL